MGGPRRSRGRGNCGWVYCMRTEPIFNKNEKTSRLEKSRSHCKDIYHSSAAFPFRQKENKSCKINESGTAACALNKIMLQVKL